MFLQLALAGGYAVLSKLDAGPATPLETLKLLAENSAQFEFEAGPDLRLYVEAHAPGVFRFRCDSAARVAAEDKPASRARQRAEMLLARFERIGETTPVAFEEDGRKGWRFEQGDGRLEISVDPVRLALYRGDRCVLSTADVPGAAPFEVVSEAASKAGCGQPFARAAFALPEGEAVYGLGETQGNPDRRGEVVVSDVPAYRALPLAWSPSGWGIYVNTLHRVEHWLGVESSPDQYQIDIEAPALDLFLFVGEPAEILNQYTQLTGRAGQPVLWAMGAWVQQDAQATPVQTAELAERLRAERIPFDNILLSGPAAWSLQGKLALEWDATRFPDARQLMALFHKHSAQVCGYGFPGVPADHPLFEELEDRMWLLADEDGAAHVFPGCAQSAGQPFGLLDLTHREVYALWCERHRQLLDDGLDAPACDVQIDIPDGIEARGGETGAVLRTVYPLLVKRALFDAVAGHKTPPEGIVWSRDLMPAAQRLPWLAGPQVENTWDGLENSLRAALSVGHSAVPATVHYFGNPDASVDALDGELYVRWLSCLTFSANFVLQGAEAFLPWRFDESVQAHVRTWLEWRYRLIPYVLGAIEDAARTGLPVQRSMALSFPNDPAAHAWDLQFLLGPAILVAPITAPGEASFVYLPAGEAWWDLNTGVRYEGGQILEMRCDLDQYPVFGREGHMLCLGPATQHTGEFNSARILDEVWMFGMPEHNPVVMRNKIRVMQMQGSSYIKGLEGLRILASDGLEVKRRGAEVRISRAR